MLRRFLVLMVFSGDWRFIFESVSSMKSWPAMREDLDLVKSMIVSVWLTMNKSRVVCEGGSRWWRWWVGTMETKDRALVSTRLRIILLFEFVELRRSALMVVIRRRLLLCVLRIRKLSCIVFVATLRVDSEAKLIPSLIWWVGTWSLYFLSLSVSMCFLRLSIYTSKREELQEQRRGEPFGWFDCGQIM